MHSSLVRNIFYPLHENLKRKPTFTWLASLEQSQWLSQQDIQTIQNQALQRLIRHAYDSVPYYRSLMDERKIAPQDIRCAADLNRLPFLTKNDLRGNFDLLQAKPLPPRTQTISTGGSTGAPVSVKVTMDAHAFGEAARFRAQHWFGIEPGAREVVLWGSPIELGRQSMWREVRDRFLNSRLLSAFDLGEPALARYTEFLHRYRPEKLYGYASALALLGKYMKRVNRTAPEGWPKAVFATAEALFPHQRTAIEEGFGCPAAVEYGSRDAGLVAHECPKGNLHINAEGIIVEVVADGHFSEQGNGEIVVTNLLSDALPLIRYRSGDIGRLDSSLCPCGRGLPVLSEVQGRQTDFLITPDGRVLHALSAIYILREISAVKEFRVIQETIDEVNILVVSEPQLTKAEESKIVARMGALLGGDVRVKLKGVDALPPIASGKFRYVISKVAERLTTDNGLQDYTKRTTD